MNFRPGYPVRELGRRTNASDSLRKPGIELRSDGDRTLAEDNFGTSNRSISPQDRYPNELTQCSYVDRLGGPGYGVCNDGFTG